MDARHDDGLRFRDAVNKTLADTREGIEILARPKVFFSQLADNCEADSKELSLFANCCSDELIQPFLEAARNRSTDGLEDASKRGAAYLREEYFIDDSHAQRFCAALASGVADNLGLSLPNLDASSHAAADAWAASANQGVVNSGYPAVFPSGSGAQGAAGSAGGAYGTGSSAGGAYGAAGSAGGAYGTMNAAGRIPQAPQAPFTQPVSPMPATYPTRSAPYPAPAPQAPQRSSSGWAKALLAVLLVAAASLGVTLFVGGSAAVSGSTSGVTSAAKVFTVSFETGGGTTIEPDEITEGQSVYSPNDPTRDGYRFVGWYRDRSHSQSVSFPFEPTKDTVLYAKWEKDTVLDKAKAFLRSNGHTYAIFDRDADWQSAESYCEELGGHLATVTSRLEQSVIEDLTAQGSRNVYWLGGYLAAPEVWEWVTGESFEYSNWSEYLPDNWIVEGENHDATEEERNDISASENALSVYRIDNPNAPQYVGEWNDLASNGECEGEAFFGLENIGYVCEWDSYVE